MSGGAFNYLDGQLRCEIFGYGDHWNNALEDLEISELTYDLLELLHEYDWYASGDTNKEKYLAAKEEFKQKWLKDPESRVKHIIDAGISRLRGELYETYGISGREAT